MNAITYALSIIKQKIPRPILEKAFISKEYHQTLIPVSIDTNIKRLVIKDRVLTDINIIGGVQVTIPLQGLPMTPVETNAVVVRIPKDRTQGRSILSVYSVSLGTLSNAAMMGGSMMQQGGELANANQQLVNSISSIPYISEAQVSLISDNVVLIRGANNLAGSLYLRCEIENDENLNNIKSRSYLTFGELCTLACKAYIYNKLIIDQDIAFIDGGAAMGRIKDIIESYDGAENDYTEMLKKTWAKVSKLNDHETVKQLVRLSTGGGF